MAQPWYKKLEEMVEFSKDYTSSVYIDASDGEGVTVQAPTRGSQDATGWGETLSEAVSECFKIWKGQS